MPTPEERRQGRIATLQERRQAYIAEQRDPTAADARALDLAQEYPEATLECGRCKEVFPLVGPSRVPCRICPVCKSSGHVSMSDEVGLWKGSLREAVSQTRYNPSSMVPIRCRDCGAVTEAPPCEAGQVEVCPECGKNFGAADRLTAELISFDANATIRCGRSAARYSLSAQSSQRPEDEPTRSGKCAARFSVMEFGLTCPDCGGVPSERICEEALKRRREEMGDWRKIKRLSELLNADSTGGKTSRLICPFCKVELPTALAEHDFTRVECPNCHHVEVYIYNREAFHSPKDCERVLEFRLEKWGKAEKEARKRDLAKAATEIAAETQPDGGQPNGGYVYVLINAAMQGHVKVGKTEREPEDRAKELSGGTGLPTPFLVAYAEWFKDCSAGEDYVHALLEQKGFRVAQNREFFCAPVKAAIQAIMKAKEREDQGGGSSPETGKTG